MEYVVISYRPEAGGRFSAYTYSCPSMYQISAYADQDALVDNIAKAIREYPEAEHCHLVFTTWADLVDCGTYAYIQDTGKGEDSVFVYAPQPDEESSASMSRDGELAKLQEELRTKVAAKLGALAQEEQRKAREEAERKLAESQRLRMQEQEARDRAEYKRLKAKFESGFDIHFEI